MSTPAPITVGRVTWAGFEAVVTLDGTWRVARDGVALPASSRALGVLYEGFGGFPDWPARAALRDWARHVRGRLELDPMPVEPEGVRV